MSQAKVRLEEYSIATGICPPCLLKCCGECDDDEQCLCPEPHVAPCGDLVRNHGPERCLPCWYECHGPDI